MTDFPVRSDEPEPSELREQANGPASSDSGAPPRVSVVMPFADAAAYLPGALAGLAALRYPDLRFILVDDGSADGSAELAAEWAAARDDASVVTMPERGGVAAARDAGVAAADGEYVWFCDADDEWDPQIVARLAEAAPADLVCCRAVRHEAGGRVQVMEGVVRDARLDSGELAEALLSGLVRGYLWNKLIRREVLAAAIADAAARDRLSSQDDFLLLLDIARHARSAVLIPFIGYRYLERPGSISTGSTLRLANTAACAEAALEELPPRLPARRSGAPVTAAGFRTWFHLVPCLATPVHQKWPGGEVARVHGELLPELTLRGLADAWRMGHRRVAVHGLALKVLGPAGAYPAAYRVLRAGIDGLAKLPVMGR
ncbi:glycosyltransferase family 2 protein [Corynebacterium hansenii]|uniref:Glycosyltransferase family 2 protein n=1 Tax=Corynebacterium hansenii TaxID=394964 RepID=A0ABV7ZNM0_9CORY|nr:glycosyltransferase family A protein [Corynebacterium hansenii]WJZ00754.1 Putative glycosyltransferase EpsH [Corynebacterium hansenii]